MSTNTAATTEGAASPAVDIQSSLGLSGVDLIAMLVSDSGLAACEPKWWNASPNGCMLIGLQPRGGWQIVQRAVQWGSDSWANCFGVDCASPVLYAYFACSIRNRLEVLASDRLRSPMEGVAAGGPWNSVPDVFTVKRPTKLIDGSRGGQAFLAEVLAPENGAHYSIADQSRLQMLSVLMVGAGLAQGESAELEGYVGMVLPKDFDMGDGLGGVFGRLAVGLAIGSIAAFGLTTATWWSLVRENLFGPALPYVVKIVSLICWAVGATGLLMLGGSPRVKVIMKGLPKHIEKRLAVLRGEVGTDATSPGSKESEGVEEEGKVEKEAGLGRVMSSTASAGAVDDILPNVEVNPGADASRQQEPRPKVARGITMLSGNTLQAVTSTTPVSDKTSEVAKHDSDEKGVNVQQISSVDLDPKVKIRFGSLHGSVFIADRGFCMLRMSIVERLCATDIRTIRTTGWYVGMSWFGMLLLGSIALQVGATLAPAFGADLLGLVFLLVSALARGAGVAGPEEWMIPKWKRRQNTANGALLLGQFDSRVGASEV